MEPTMEKIKYFTQKELKKLFRSIERQKDYPFVLRDSTLENENNPFFDCSMDL
jgi:hypothetical protein